MKSNRKKYKDKRMITLIYTEDGRQINVKHKDIETAKVFETLVWLDTHNSKMVWLSYSMSKGRVRQIRISSIVSVVYETREL